VVGSCTEVARIEQTIKHQQERGRQLQDDLEQTRASLAEAESHLGEDREKLSSWEGEVETLAPELETLQALEESSAEALLQAEEAMHHWQHHCSAFRIAAVNWSRKKSSSPRGPRMARSRPWVNSWRISS
jgi:chromosome segregation protein